MGLRERGCGVGCDWGLIQKEMNELKGAEDKKLAVCFFCRGAREGQKKERKKKKKEKKKTRAFQKGERDPCEENERAGEIRAWF